MKDLLVMFPFFRKRLLVETNPEEIARITEILKKEALPFQIYTKTSRGAIGRIIDVNMFANYRQPGYGNILTHVYYVHVMRSDYDRARKLITQ